MPPSIDPLGLPKKKRSLLAFLARSVGGGNISSSPERSDQLGKVIDRTDDLLAVSVVNGASDAAALVSANFLCFPSVKNDEGISLILSSVSY